MANGPVAIGGNGAPARTLTRPVSYCTEPVSLSSRCRRQSQSYLQSELVYQLFFVATGNFYQFWKRIISVVKLISRQH